MTTPQCANRFACRSSSPGAWSKYSSPLLRSSQATRSYASVAWSRTSACPTWTGLSSRKSSANAIRIFHGDIPLTVRAMRAGAVDFLEKPFAREALLASVARALEIGNQAAEAAGNAQDIRARIATLTPREREVFDLVVAGKQSKVIAYELGASPRTIEVHRGRMMSKLKAQSLQDLVRMAIAAGVARG